MSWNSSIQFNNLYRAYLSLSASAIVNPLANDMNANNKNITNVNTITSTTCATQTLTANTFNGSILGGNSTSASYYIGATSIPLLYLTNVNNIAIGNNTLNAISSATPQANIAIGTDALRYGQPSTSIAIGYAALTLSGGQFCVGLGHLAGNTHTTGTGSMYLGAASVPSAASVNNEIVLGYQAVGKGDNTIQLGNASATTLYTPATVRSNTGTLTLNSQGGALNLQSAGTTYASVDANGITSANFNGKISVVGATTNSGNLVLCNNTTNLTGNFNLLTDSNQHLKFTSTNNVLTVGGATSGSIVVPSTAGFITAPTISNGANDFTIGTSSSLYTTVYSTNINNSLYPSAPYGSQSGSFCWNANAFGGEFSFMNNFGSSGSGGFTFNDRTGTSSKRLLAKITENNFDIGVNANLTVGNGNINASPSGATLSLYASNNGSVNLIARSGGNIGFYTNNGGGSGGNFNAMTINSFASGGVQAGYIDIFHANGVASGSAFEQFVYNGLVIGAILQSGTTAISIYYGSDYRLKSNVKPIDTSLLYRLKPCSFTWTQDNRDDIGFIAHEFQEVFPDSVINQKDQVDENGKPKIQMMSNTVCIPLLVACVKEHQQQIVNQQEQIATLESKLASLTALVESLVAGRV